MRAVTPTRPGSVRDAVTRTCMSLVTAVDVLMGRLRVESCSTNSCPTAFNSPAAVVPALKRHGPEYTTSNEGSYSPVSSSRTSPGRSQPIAHRSVIRASASARRYGRDANTSRSRLTIRGLAQRSAYPRCPRRKSSTSHQTSPSTTADATWQQPPCRVRTHPPGP